jgi:hypothetical protein
VLCIISYCYAAYESVIARGELTVKQIMIQKDPDALESLILSSPLHPTGARHICIMSLEFCLGVLVCVMNHGCSFIWFSFFFGYC